MPSHRRILPIVFFAVFLVATPAHAEVKQFSAGALIIPMDLTYQDHGLFQAYGLLFQLLRQGITVHWVIDPGKVWHPAPCDTAGDACDWDCEEEGSGEKCPYPTASPDLYATTQVLWDDDDRLAPGTPIVLHGYRGGPFVIDAPEAGAARDIIDIWNDPDLWAYYPWAQRTVGGVVSVHQATAPFDGDVRKTMTAAPTIAVFSDGNEDIATKYLRAAGIPQSSGAEFPAGKCAAGTCGPGTANPDMLTVESVMGDMGTCDAPNLDHANGALFTGDGLPAYCQIMSMHWNVAARETVECDGGNCPALQADCTGLPITYHGHEVVAEVRQFLQHRTHFFGECQAVNAYENLVPNPAWPFLDDEGRKGHFLTTAGTPPDCPCTDGDFECVTGGCDGGARDCCIPKDLKEKGAGYMIAAQPASATLQILHPEVPYIQLDGAFSTVGGSEPAYNLSETLGSAYINDMDVTFITGPDGPGVADVWMTGYIDGDCSIIEDDVWVPEQCNKGKVSYLGGHSYSVNLPISSNGASQGTRLFLNALFEADCVSAEGQPRMSLTWLGDLTVPAQDATLPVTRRYTLYFTNAGGGSALDATLRVRFPGTLAPLAAFEDGGTIEDNSVLWTLGNIGASGSTSPPASGSRWFDAAFPALGDYNLEAELLYRVGVSTLRLLQPVVVRVLLDSDGDLIPDELDPWPLDPLRCGDGDGDGCDDCAAEGTCDPEPDAGPDGDIDDPGRDNADGDCSCSAGASTPVGPLPLLFVFGMLWAFRRRTRNPGGNHGS
ncbi:hypothetical protein KKC22_11110 [Myxococcota bacterium]|nr:hypothetical protein [Myxococcota bacterium]